MIAVAWSYIAPFACTAGPIAVMVVSGYQATKRIRPENER
jgi:hypothetical protein